MFFAENVIKIDSEVVRKCLNCDRHFGFYKTSIFYPKGLFEF